MTITADCELWLDGQRVPDRAHQLLAGETTALSALVLHWGRGDSVSQPDATTCQFTLHGGVTDAPLETVHVGMPVEVYASGLAHIDGVPYYPEDDFGSLPLGPLDPLRYGQDGVFIPTVIDTGAVASTELRRNHATTPNPGDGTAWRSNNGSLYTFTYDAAGGRRAGAGAIKCVRTANTPNNSIASAYMVGVTAWTVPGRVPCAAGEVWTVSVWARASVASRHLHQLNLFDAAGVVVLTVTSATVDGAANEWVRTVNTVTVPANATNMGIGNLSVSLLPGGGVAVGGETTWMCDCLYEKVPTLGEYFSGDYSPDPLLIPAWVGTANASPSTLTTLPVDPARVINLAGVSDGSLWVTPLPYGVTPDAWDTLPKIIPGQTWQVSVTARIPVGTTGQLIARSYSAPNAGGLEQAGSVTVAAPPITGTGTATTVTGTLTLGADRPSPVWIALGLAVRLPGGPTWDTASGTWEEHPETWGSYATADIERLQAITEGGSVRRVLVFAGSVTDAIATPADVDDTVEIEVTAADISADMGADVIGGEPWPLEPLGDRVARIQGLSRLGVPTNVDAALAGTLVSWRDVDAQPVLDLLRDLAQTGGGVLWPSAHATTGGYLWIEDPAQRAALRTLALDAGVIVIVGGTGSGVDVLSACDVLRDPVQLSQTVSEVTTTVTVGWKDQTLDDDGNQAPTDVSVTVTDETAFAKYGLRRMQISTELASDTDARDLANRALAKSRNVAWKASGYTMHTAYLLDDVPSVSRAERMETLLDLLDGTTRIGQAIVLIDLPGFLPDNAGRAYVEGGGYTYADGFWELELTITPAEQSAATLAWEDLDPAWQWQQWQAGLTWADLYGVGTE